MFQKTKVCYIFLKNFCYIFREMEISSPKYKEFQEGTSSP